MSLGFIGGLAAAAQGYNQASKDWEAREQAQAAEQRRTEDHAYNQQKRQIEMDELERAKTIRAETEAAAKPLEVQAAQEQLGDDVAGPPATLYKAGDQTFADETKAKTYATDPNKAIERVMEVKRNRGDALGALTLGQQMMQSRLTDWKFADTKKAREAAAINDTMAKRLFDPSGDLWGNGARVLSELDKDGNTYKPERQANGTIVMNRYGPDGALLGPYGAPVPAGPEGQRMFAEGFMNAPSWQEKSAQLSAWAKAQQEQQKQTLQNQVQQSTIARNMAQATGTGGYTKTGSGTKGGSAGKKEKTGFDLVVDQFDKYNPSTNPVARAEAINVARQAYQLNRDAKPEEIAYAAQVAATEGADSPNIKQRLDMNTGQVVAAFEDPRTGKQIKLHQAQPKPEMTPMLKAEVQQYLKQQDELGASLGSQMQWSEALKRAAANPKNSSAVAQVVQNTIASTLPAAQATVMQQWEAANAQRIAAGQPQYPRPTPDQIRAKVAQTVSSPQGMAAINNRLNLIRTYGLN